MVVANFLVLDPLQKGLGSWSGNDVPINLYQTNVILCADKKGWGPEIQLSPSEVLVLARRKQISVGSSLRAKSPKSSQLSSLREPGSRTQLALRLLRLPVQLGQDPAGCIPGRQPLPLDRGWGGDSPPIQGLSLVSARPWRELWSPAGHSPQPVHQRVWGVSWKSLRRVGSASFTLRLKTTTPGTVGWMEPLQFSSVQSLSRVRLFATPLITAHQASLSITNSRSPLKLVPIESVMPSSHLILCRPLLLLPPIPPMSQLFAWGSQSIGVSASTPVLPMNTQNLSPSGRTGWISLQSKGLSRVFNTIVQKHQFFGAQLSSQSNSHIHTWPLEKPQPWLDRPLLTK